jgi:hypothetical protein
VADRPDVVIVMTDEERAVPPYESALHDLRAHLRMQLKTARATAIPERHRPWPYADRRPAIGETDGIARRLWGRVRR